MNNIEKVNINKIRFCFDELRCIFTLDQSFKIILVILSMSWIKNNPRYSNESFSVLKDLGEHGFGEKLRNLLEELEKKYPEFRGLLTGLIDSVYNYPDMNLNRKLRSTYEKIDSFGLTSKEEVKEFIKNIVSKDEYHTLNDTPESLANLIYRLLDFKKINRMAMYCCSTSKIALTIYENLRQSSIDKYLYYYGEEIVLTTTLISRLLMIIFEITDSEIRNNDVLVSDYHECREKYDLVITDMPQISYYEESLIYSDKRLKYGKPIRNSADWLFGQNALYHINDDGIGIIIGTKGTLVRNNEIEIRRRIIEEDLVECVITLPTNLYEKASTGVEMIIFNKKKPENRKKKVLFINASNESMRLNRLQHTITQEGINKISKCYKEGVEIEDFSKFIGTEKIMQFNYTWNPAEYLDFDVLKESLNDSVLLKDISQISRGVHIKKEELVKSDNEDAYYYLNIKNIEEGRVKYDSEMKVVNIKNDWIGKFDIIPNDILVTSKGWTLKFSIVEEDFKPAFLSSNLSRIRVDSNKYNPYVLLEFFQSEIGKKMIEGIQTGTTVKVLNNTQLERFEIPMFDIEQMNDIGKKIKNNRIEYESSIKEAQIRFETNRKEYTEKLKTLITKNS